MNDPYNLNDQIDSDSKHDVVGISAVEAGEVESKDVQVDVHTHLRDGVQRKMEQRHIQVSHTTWVWY
jgi:hypothetical protein